MLTNDLTAILKFCCFLFLLNYALGISILRAVQADGGRWRDALLAVSCGFVVTLPLSLFAHLVGLRPFSFFVAVGIVALVLLFVQAIIARTIVREVLTIIGAGIVFCIVFLILSFDIWVVGISEYFPITNGDTISYLSHIDQIRRWGGWPIQTTDSGLLPHIHHAKFLRAAVASWSAAIAKTAGLLTYQSFFLELRFLAAAIITTVLAWGLSLSLPKRWFAAAAFFLLFSNVFLHQILQQFLSSLAGSVFAALTFVLALSRGLSRSKMALIGASFGCAFTASPEASPFYAVALTIVLLPELVKDRARTKGLAAFFVVGFMLVAGFMAIPLSYSIFVQANQYRGGHPGDWFAVPESILQLTGIDLVAIFPPALTNLFPLVASFLVILIVLYYFGQKGYSYLQLMMGQIKASHNNSDRLASLASFVFVILILAFFSRRGYAYLKISEYFNFVLPMIIFATASLFSKIHYNRLAFYAFLIFVTISSVGAMVGRVRLINAYDNNIALRGPIFSIIKGDCQFDRVGALLLSYPPNLTEFVAYLNAQQQQKITLPENVARFQSVHAALPKVKMSTFTPSAVDITDAPQLVPGPFFTSLNGAITIDPAGDWLPAEAFPATFRWLGSRGSAKLITEKEAALDLHFVVSNGPDLHPDAVFRVVVDGEKVAELPAWTGAREIQIPLSQVDRTARSIVFLIDDGGKSGLRKVSIKDLYVIDRSTGLRLPKPIICKVD